VVVAGIVGIAGLQTTLAAVRQGANLALANKESMVCAGALLRVEATRSGARFLPIDSEHNAIFQVLDRPERVEKLILTASGGPFRDVSMSEMASATPEQACAHPNWMMGAKISVDSATMMNKGLELIEAAYLFDVPEPRIEVLVHPQSIIHSLVAYDDGSVLAQLGLPDMRTPISYALSWPSRMPLSGRERLDLAKIGRLDFLPPDPQRFPALRLARTAVSEGGGAPIVLNGANEVAVAAFLQRRIGFLTIAEVAEQVLEEFLGNPTTRHEPAGFDEVYEIDRWARSRAIEKLRLAA
jgi:1-deoxy-D-xylulose-5-phosphate reductoisomerase